MCLHIYTPSLPSRYIYISVYLWIKIYYIYTIHICGSDGDGDRGGGSRNDDDTYKER